MAGIYHITTTDFDPSVHINDSTPLHNRVHDGTYGYTGPGPPKGDSHTTRHKTRGSDSSTEIIINIDVSNSPNFDNNLNGTPTDESLPGQLSQPTRGNFLVPNAAVTRDRTSRSAQRFPSGSTCSSESDEGICLDQECVYVSRQEADCDKLLVA